MKIAIIAAMAKELALLIPLLSSPQTTEINGFTIYEGNIGQTEVVMMQCGIGKVNAAMGALTIIEHCTPDAVVNTGVAGGCNNVNVMDVVVGERVAYHDVWCGPESMRGAMMGLPQFFEGDKRLISCLPDDPTIVKGLIASGDWFVDTREVLGRICDLYPDTKAVDMESASIAHVCHLRGVPFLSLRVISDSPGASHDNTRQYNDFWTEAPQHTFEIVRQMIDAAGKL